MGKIIYSNLSASSINYPVIDFLLNIKEFYEKGDLLILCFWDFNIFKNRNDFDHPTKLREITSEVSKFLTGIEINHKIIYLSDSIKRLNNNEDLYRLSIKCFNNIEMGEIEDIYGKIDYLKLRPTTLGKINFMVLDYLTALFFKQLYPQFAKDKVVDVYHTGERFIGIKDAVEETISKEELIVRFPKIEFWRAIPILNYCEGNWISTSMSKKEIERIIRENYPKNIRELEDIINIGLRLNDSQLNYKIKDFLKKIEKKINSKEIIIQETASIINSYLEIIKNLMDNSAEGEIKKITYIDSKEKLKKILESLNPSKLEILKYCNGKYSIEEISKLVSMKESSTRSYISRMKKEKLISESKKPTRLVDEIVISFE